LTKSPIDENICTWGKEIQIWIVKDSKRILEGLINLNEELITRKLVFGVDLGVNSNKLKLKDLISFFGCLIGRIRSLIVRILKFNGQLGT